MKPYELGEEFFGRHGSGKGNLSEIPLKTVKTEEFAMNTGIIERLPNVSKSELVKHFPKIDVKEYPELINYSWEDCHKGSMGAGDLFLTSELAKKINIKKGMRILELGAGNCLSAIFLAKKYKVEIIAADLWVDPTSNWQRIKDEGVEKYVKPIKMDARNIPFPEGYFDVVFSMNSYFYFGTDDLYLPYLKEYVKENGIICIASPCFSSEFENEIPEEFLFDAPDFKESYSIHSPKWWKNHFEKVKQIEVLECVKHPKGREFWLDSIRWQIESGRNINYFLKDIIMLLKDENEFLTYFTLIARNTKTKV